MNKPRIATNEETNDIRAALAAAGHFDLDWNQLADMIPQDIVVREGYMSDGPGFVGKLAWIVHGEPGINTILGKASGVAWRIMGVSDESSASEQSCRHLWRNNILDDGSTNPVSRDYCVNCGIDR